MDTKRKTELQEIARQIRVGIIDAVYSANSGHPGGSLSIADVLAYLYFEELNIDPKNPDWEGRDRMVLSKGHCAPGLYSALAHRGYFPVGSLSRLTSTSSYPICSAIGPHAASSLAVPVSFAIRSSLFRGNEKERKTSPPSAGGVRSGGYFPDPFITGLQAVSVPYVKPFFQGNKPL